MTVDKASAATGETITITTTSNTAKYVPVVTVTDADGNEVAVSTKTAYDRSTKKAEFTFTMPASNVTVNVSFEEQPLAPSAAIDVEVPANLGDMTPATAGQITDLYAFLQSYLQDSPNPAYIKLTLQPGAEYIFSNSLETMCAIQIIGDANDPATIKRSSRQPFVKIKSENEATPALPNDKGFYTTIYNVEFKNLIFEYLYNSLFTTNSQKYHIPNFTIDNIIVRSGNYIINEFYVGVLENFKMTNSTIYYDYGGHVTYLAYPYASWGSTLAQAGIDKQTITMSNNTLWKSGALWHTDDGESAKRTITVDHNVIVEDDATFMSQLYAYDANCTVQHNAFQRASNIDNETNLNFTDLSATEDANGAAGSIKGNMVWFDYYKIWDNQYNRITNIPLGDCPQKTAKIGDPRWLNAKLIVRPWSNKVYDNGYGDLDDDNDLAKVINAGVKKGYTQFELLQNSSNNVRCSVKQPIVATTGLVITGENVRIDVDHDDVFIKLASEPTAPYMKKYTAAASAPALNRAPAADETDYYAFNELKLKGLQITGLKNSIIYDNNVKYCVVDLTIDDCVLALETEAVENEALISFKAGGAKDFTIKNSTVYGNNAVAKYFIRYNNSARLDRYGFNKDADFQTMTYQNNTFYGLLKSDGQWGNYNGISGQNYSKFVVEKNIWYNCGKDLIRRMAGGRFGNGAPLTFDKNTYFNDGADISASEASYDKSGTALMSDPGFKKPGDGDFTLSAYAEQCVERTGDPRWFANGGHYNNATAIEGMTTETADDDAPMYNLSGQRVTKSYKGIVIKNGKKVMVK